MHGRLASSCSVIRATALVFFLSGCGGALSAGEDALEQPSSPAIATAVTPTAATTAATSSPAPAPAEASPPKAVTIANATASVGDPSDRPPGVEEDEAPIDFEVAGGMSAAQQNVLKIVGRCLVNALERGENPVGALWVEVTVDDEGKATGVRLADGFSPRMKECIPPRVMHVSFSPFAQDGSIRSASRVLRFPINELTAEQNDPE